MKKRYPRAVRFRRIASNNNSVQQVRRFPLIPFSTAISAQTVELEFEQPVIIASNAVAITNIVDNNGDKPISFAYGAGVVSQIEITFPGGGPTSITIPFEDPALRGQVGQYVQQGTYTPPG
jgi:hypothetical protein